MIRISEKLARLLQKEHPEIGLYSEEMGAIIGVVEYIIADLKKGIYLTHKSDYDFAGILIKLKKK